MENVAGKKAQSNFNLSVVGRHVLSNAFRENAHSWKMWVWYFEAFTKIHLSCFDNSQPTQKNIILKMKMKISGLSLSLHSSISQEFRIYLSYNRQKILPKYAEQMYF